MRNERDRQLKINLLMWRKEAERVHIWTGRSDEAKSPRIRGALRALGGAKTHTPHGGAHILLEQTETSSHWKVTDSQGMLITDHMAT